MGGLNKICIIRSVELHHSPRVILREEETETMEVEVAMHDDDKRTAILMPITVVTPTIIKITIMIK